MLRRVAKEGPGAFYTGEIAEDMVAVIFRPEIAGDTDVVLVRGKVGVNPGGIAAVVHHPDVEKGGDILGDVHPENFGVMPNVLYQEESRRFGEGDVLLVYTDGLIEARNRAGEFYGIDRVEARVAGLTGMDAAGIRDAVLADLDAFTGDVALRDDVTLVVVRGVPGGQR